MESPAEYAAAIDEATQPGYEEWEETREHVLTVWENVSRNPELTSKHLEALAPGAGTLIGDLGGSRTIETILETLLTHPAATPQSRAMLLGQVWWYSTRIWDPSDLLDEKERAAYQLLRNDTLDPGELQHLAGHLETLTPQVVETLTTLADDRLRAVIGEQERLEALREALHTAELLHAQ